MNPQTITTLNAVNRDFYHRFADDFSATRRAPWKGWRRLLPLVERQLAATQTLSILDVGCGNGRFGRFCAKHLAKPFTYFGVDASAPALEHAANSLSGIDSLTLIRHDVVAEKCEDILPRRAHRSFHLVVAFGLLHHVPSRDRRQALLGELSRRVDLQGILAISIWQFARFERFRRKIISWEAFQEKTGIAIDPQELEPGDYVLSWGTDPSAHRYCHFLDSGEASQLIDSLPLDLAETYVADGATETLNRYYLLVKRSQSRGT